MKLRTELPLKEQKTNLIDHNSNILSIGSCFSKNIGNKLQYFKFNTIVNPFGILFHPKAIENFIEYVVYQKVFTEKDVIKHNELWHCFDAHSILSCSDKNKLLKNLNDTITSTHEQLTKSSHLIITLGTSWVYRYTKTNRIVANCHKVPQKNFSKEILKISEVSQSLQQINKLIHSINKKIQIIYTVSPVRHIKDGFIENQQSKSHLITSIHQTINQKNITYFPSYEIMMDELRDYRFYKEDMIHPSITAINYIWDKFREIWITNDAKLLIDKVDIIQKGLTHRAINPNSVAHKKFLSDLSQKISNLQKELPNIKF